MDARDRYALLRLASTLRDAGVQQQDARRAPAHVGAGVAELVARPEQLLERIGERVIPPQHRPYAIALLTHLVADRDAVIRNPQQRVQELHVAEVEKIVDNELVVRSDHHAAADKSERRVAEHRDFWRLRGWSALGIVPHPDPEHAVAFHDGIAAHPCARWNLAVAMRIERTLPGSVEAQAMIRTLQLVADEQAQ